ncbi:CHAT domain-containing protein [Streptomyces purpureus]|uniref:CHAT domain-containing tetratricopeptide repeat protein n=1 Tax=Streptomyces purpureus TaxID=1951 RepID=UPI0037B6BF23
MDEEERRALREVSAALAEERPFDDEQLTEAARLFRQGVVSAAEANDPVRPAILSNLAVVLHMLYGRTGDLAVLDEAVEAGREAVATTPEGDPGLAPSRAALTSVLHERSIAQTERFRRSRAAEDLLLLVALLRETSATAEPGHTERVEVLARLMLALWWLFRLSSDRSALDESAETGRLLLSEAPEDHPQLLPAMGNLATVLSARHRHTGSLDDLRESVAISRCAVAVIPPEHPELPNHLTNLASQLRDLYQASGDVEVLEESVETAELALALLPQDRPAPLPHLTNLAVSLTAGFERDSSADSLLRAVELHREVARRAREMPADPGLALRLSNLCGVLLLLDLTVPDPEAVREAVGLAREAVALTPPEHPEFPLRAAQLASAWRRWHESLPGGATHQDAAREAEAAVRTALDALAHGHRAGAGVLTNFCGILLANYRQTGHQAKLDAAVEAGRKAVGRASADDPDRPLCVLNLSIALRTLHEHTGDPEPLTEAVRIARTVLDDDRLPPRHPQRAPLLMQLSLGLRAEYQRGGELRVLTEAIRAGRAGVAACPSDHSTFFQHQSNLAAALMLLHQRGDTASPDVIEEAVGAARSAVDAVAPTHPRRPALLSHLCMALIFQYEVTRAPGAIALAVGRGREAVRESPPGHPELTERLANLTTALRLLHRLDGSPGTLDELVSTARRAVASLPAGHPAEASVLATGAAALRAAYRVNGEPEVIGEALGYLDRATRSRTSPVHVRIKAARSHGRYAMQAGDPERALGAYETAVDLLGQLAPWRLARGDREFGLGEMSGLGSEAAAAAVALGRPERAVELLEQSRGVLLHQSMDMRGGLDDLRQAAPGLAAEFDALRVRRDAADHAGLGERPVDDGAWEQRAATERAELDAAWQELLGRIRQVHGFAEFLGRPRLSVLQEQAAAGPVILLYASMHGGGALVLTADRATPVRSVRLPEVTESEAIRRAEALLTSRAPAGETTIPYGEARRRHRVVTEVLAWQWDTVAGPVLDAIGLAPRPHAEDSNWPRVWWCPAGVMAFLPWHASGHHGEPEPGAAVLDRAVSSWTPTVRALAHTRRAREESVAGVVRDGALVVDTPDAPGLTRAADESARVGALLSRTPLVSLSGPSATGTGVLGALASRPVAHFVCHGVSEWADPGSSGLLLTDEEDPLRLRRLTVDSVRGLRLADAALAYLSACSTTVGNQLLADESVHITAGFLLAGYRHVIGTLWPVNDVEAMRIAVDFYGALTDAGTSPPDTGRSAHALHRAVHAARDRHRATPALWSAHLHAGA